MLAYRSYCAARVTRGNLRLRTRPDFDVRSIEGVHRIESRDAVTVKRTRAVRPLGGTIAVAFERLSSGADIAGLNWG